MGIALSAVHGFFAPLQGLMAWLVAAPGPSRPAAAPVFVAPHADLARPAAQKGTCARAQRPLRVVRVMDKPGSHAGGAAGRMVISGRMADVCAELDRLAAMEAGATTRH